MVATLEDLLTEAQRIGLIGPGTLRTAIDQAAAFAVEIPAGPATVVDVGSGGGLPGLVLCRERADITLTLMDRRGRACDFLRRAVRALEWGGRAVVVHRDVAELGHDPAWRGRFDVATARGVGSPSLVAELVLPLVRPGGRLVVSTVGQGAAWSDDGLDLLDARVLSRHDGIVVVEAGRCDPRYPRARQLPPLFGGPGCST